MYIEWQEEGKYSQDSIRGQEQEEDISHIGIGQESHEWSCQCWGHSNQWKNSWSFIWRRTITDEITRHQQVNHTFSCAGTQKAEKEVEEFEISMDAGVMFFSFYCVKIWDGVSEFIFVKLMASFEIFVCSNA